MSYNYKCFLVYKFEPCVGKWNKEGSHNFTINLQKKVHKKERDSEAIMLGEKRRLVEPSNKETYVTGCSYTTTVAVTCGASQGGDAVSISAFISHLDDTTKKRLDRMNQRLRQLEQQMEAIEAEMTKASEE